MNCWPSKEQILLLKAALLPPQQACRAWQEYSSKYVIEDADAASHILLPLIYHNIQEQGVCKSSYRYWWFSNHLLLKRLNQVYFALQACGANPCFLKGVALTLCCYPKLVGRGFGDTDLLIERHKIHEAVACLLQHGWQPIFEVHDLDSYARRHHALHLKNEYNNVIDLHWWISPQCFLRDSVEKFHYKRAIIFSKEFGGHVTVLCPEDCLVHIFLHGIAPSSISLMRWVADATYILRHHPEFDWSYFFLQVEQLKIVFIVKKALLYLHKNEFILLPSSVLQKLSAYKYLWHERRRYFLNSYSFVGLVHFVRLTYHECKVYPTPCGFFGAWRRVFGYFYQRWGCKGSWDFSVQMVCRTFKLVFRV